MRKLLFVAISAVISFTFGYAFAPPRPQQELHVPEDHFEMVLSPTNSQLISVPWLYKPESAVRIWNIDTGAEVAALTMPKREPSDFIQAQYAPDGQTLLAGSWKASNLYSSSGELLHRFERCSIRYSPNAQFIFVETVDEKPVEPGFWPKSFLSLWNIRQSRTEWSMASEMPVAFDFDGSHFVTRDQKRLVHWELSPTASPKRLHEHVVDAAFGFDTNLQRFVDTAQTTFDVGPLCIRLRDMETGQIRNTIAFSPLGNNFPRPVHQKVHLCTDQHVMILEQSINSASVVLPGTTRVIVGDTSNTFELLNNESATVELSETKRWLAIRSSDRFLIWDMTNLREHLARPIKGNTWPATLRLTVNGDYFFTGDELDGSQASWDSLDKCCFGLFSRLWPDTSRIQVWDMLRKAPVLSIPLTRDAVFSPDGRWIATKHDGGIVRIWNIEHHTNWPLVAEMAGLIWIVLFSIGFGLRLTRRRLAFAFPRRR